MKFIKAFIINIIFFAALCAAAQAAQKSLEQGGFSPKEVRPGDVATYTLVFNNISPKISLRDIPIPEGLEYVGSGQSTSMSIVNGDASASVELTLSFRAQNEGVYTIKAWQIKYEGQTYSVNEAALKVDANAPEQTSSQTMSGNAASAQSLFSSMFPQRGASRRQVRPKEISLEGKISLEIKLPKGDIYIGQALPCEVVFACDKSLAADGLTLAQLAPELKKLDAFNCQGFEANPTVDTPADSDKVYYKYKTVITPIKEGSYYVNLSVQGVFLKQVSIEDMMNMSIFERMELSGGAQIPFTKSLEETKINVLPLPVEGKPANFSGAIGKFMINSCNIEPAAVSVGDPCTMTIVLSGIGNFDRLGAPDLNCGADWKSYKPKISFKDESDGMQYIGLKSLEYIVVPNKADLKTAPAFEFSYFDPADKKYKTITAPQTPVSVAPRAASAGALNKSESQSDEAPKTEPGKIIEDKRDHSSADSLLTNAVFLGLQALIIGALAVFITLKIKSNRMLANPQYAKKVRMKKELKKLGKSAVNAAKHDDVKMFFGHAKAALQAALCIDTPYEASAITLREAEEILHKKDFAQYAESIAEFFEGADAISYGRLDAGSVNLSTLSARLKEITSRLVK